jgi:hypothetical protein
MYGKKLVQFIFIAHDLLPVREWIQILELTFFKITSKYCTFIYEINFYILSVTKTLFYNLD